MRFEILPTENDAEVILVDKELHSARTLPRFLPWWDIGTLPTELLTPLSEWANLIEYDRSSYLGQTDMSKYRRIEHGDAPRRSTTWAGQVADSLGIGKQERILDFGTGVGAARLGLLRDGYDQTVGVDISADCLKRQADWAVRLGLSTADDAACNLLTSAAFRSRIADYLESFSLIIITSSLHHIADLTEFCRFCASLLKPGGRLYATNEPINKQRFHQLNDGDGVSRRVDLLELYELMDKKINRRSASTTMMAEIWDGSGFSRPRMEEILSGTGFDLASWNCDTWLSYIFNHSLKKMLRDPQSPDTKRKFSELYEQVLKIDRQVRLIARKEFVERNYFTVNFVAVRRAAAAAAAAQRGANAG